MARQLSMTFFGKVIEGICILTILVSRIGALHSVVFAGFSAESVAQRISDCKPKDQTPPVSTGQPAGVINFAKDQALQPAADTPISTVSNAGTLAQYRFGWKQALLDVGLLAISGAGTTLVFMVLGCALDQFGNKSIMSAASFSAPVAGSSYVGLKPSPPKLFQMKDSVAWNRKTVSNGSKTHCMKTWNPIDNKKFETLSYLPPLTDDSIAREIDYMMKKGWIPCLEFDAVR
ncbi:hypothetical protein AgCh_031172 [Apium graveolens]